MSLLRNIASSTFFKNEYTSAIILAAGAGTRFGNENGTKQNVMVAGIPAVVRSISAFENCGIINEIIIVGREEELEILKSYVAEYSFKKVAAVTAGGATRDASAAAGFAKVNDKCKFVAVHDAARCLVTPDIIEETVRAAYRHGASAAAESVVDTVKTVDSDGFITSTVDRNTVRLVKTPQVFMKNMYMTALECAKRDKAAVTDDCMMVERLGFKIKLVDCGKDNIKLTERSDLHRAELILKMREESGNQPAEHI